MNTKRLGHRGLALLAVTLLAGTGCASITGSKLQPVSVQTIQDNKEVIGAGCTLTNDTGKWFITTPGSVTIQKSTADLTVECNKDNVAVGRESVESKANGNVWGNIVAGGGIGYIIDRNTGAGFDYPTVITVFLKKVGEAVGLVAPQAPLAAQEAAPNVVAATTAPTAK